MRRPRLAGAAAVAGLLAVLATSTSVPSAPAATSPARLLVTATEFRLGLSRARLTAGSAIVELTNRGQDDHDLVVRRLTTAGREIGPLRRFPVTRPGLLSTRTLRLTAGPYVLYCTLPGHRRLGMQARLRVRR